MTVNNFIRGLFGDSRAGPSLEAGLRKSEARPPLARLIAVSLAGLLPAIANAVDVACTIDNTEKACRLREQSYQPGRASIVNLGIGSAPVIRLRTEPGDSYVAGSGMNERADLRMSQAATGCYPGQEQWWAHSIMFPDDYVAPAQPTPGNWTWGAVFDFHNSVDGAGQPNFQINAMWDGLSFQIYAGDPANPVTYLVPIGPVVKNIWYDFVYHVRWSAGSDGYFYAWVNGEAKLAYTGPTLYVNQGCYLKLANYHTPLNQPSSVVHGRIIRGTTRADVTPTPPTDVALTPPGPPAPPPPVVPLPPVIEPATPTPPPLLPLPPPEVAVAPPAPPAPPPPQPPQVAPPDPSVPLVVPVGLLPLSPEVPGSSAM